MWLIENPAVDLFENIGPPPDIILYLDFFCEFIRSPDLISSSEGEKTFKFFEEGLDSIKGYMFNLGAKFI